MVESHRRIHVDCRTDRTVNHLRCPAFAFTSASAFAFVSAFAFDAASAAALAAAATAALAAASASPLSLCYRCADVTSRHTFHITIVDWCRCCTTTSEGGNEQRTERRLHTLQSVGRTTTPSHAPPCSVPSETPYGLPSLSSRVAHLTRTPPVGGARRRRR